MLPCSRARCTTSRCARTTAARYVRVRVCWGERARKHVLASPSVRLARTSPPALLTTLGCWRALYLTELLNRSRSQRSVSVEALVLDRGVQNAIGFGSQALEGLSWKFHGFTGALDGRGEAFFPGVVPAIEGRVGNRQAPIRRAALAEVEARAHGAADAVF